jgi:ribosomal protein S18 acetylase RimI-like enzyme
MVGVRETVPGDWQALRDIRLEALRDAPSAFASSYACEAARGEEHWRGRSSGGGMFLAYLTEVSQSSASQSSASQFSASQSSASQSSASQSSASQSSASQASAIQAREPAGLAGGYQVDPVTVELVSMYVRPRGRGRGVGEALVAAVVGWAAARRATSVHLWVTETNAPARALYQRCGFALTGERQPLPSDPALSEVAMARPLAASSAELRPDPEQPHRPPAGEPLQR